MVLPDILAMFEATGPMPKYFLSVFSLTFTTHSPLTNCLSLLCWFPASFHLSVKWGLSRGSSPYYLIPSVTAMDEFPDLSPTHSCLSQMPTQISTCTLTSPFDCHAGIASRSWPFPDSLIRSSTSSLYPSFQDPKTHVSIPGIPLLPAIISSLSPDPTATESSHSTSLEGTQLYLFMSIKTFLF